MGGKDRAGRRTASRPGGKRPSWRSPGGPGPAGGISVAGDPLGMSQLDRLARSVNQNIRIRGRQYFDAKTVRILFADPDFVSAKVTGTREYDVDLEREGNALVYSCDCPYFEDRQEVCKHVWATLLALHHAGQFQRWAPSFPAELIPTGFDGEPDDAYADGSDFEDEEDFPDAYVPSWRPAPGEKPPSLSRPESWQLLLNKMKEAETPQEPVPAWPADREIVYILEYSRFAYGASLSIRVEARDRRKNGDWKKPRPLALPQGRIGEVPDPADREILSRLVGVNREKWFTRPYDPGYRFHPLRQDLLLVLPAMSATGRLYFSTPDSGDPRSVRWDDAGPWELCVEARPDDAGGRFEICGVFRRGGASLGLGQADYVFEEGILVQGGTIAPYRGSYRWISLFGKEGSFFVPRDETDEWIETMLQLPSAPRMELPEELQLKEIEVEPKPVAGIRASQEPWNESNLVGEVSFEYLGHILEAGSGARCIALVPERKRILRNHDSENRMLREFELAGFRKKSDYRGRDRWMLPQSRLPEAVRSLVLNGWHVEAEGKVFRNPRPLSLHLSTGIDWFELHGSIEFGESRVPVPRLLAALKRRENTILLDDGTYGMLPEEWIEKYSILAGLGTSHGDHVRFRRNQAGLLDALLASRPEVSCDALFDHVRGELRRFGGIQPAQPPEGFHGALRPYQAEGLGWLHFLRQFGFGGCLADDMGLGKTVQVLALLEERRALRADAAAADRVPPSLVVMPRSLVFNWRQEAARFTPGLRVLEHTGGVRIRGHRHFDAYDAVFTTYGTLRRDASFFKDKMFDYIILDEAQAIKNFAAKRSQAAMNLNGNMRLITTGTPIENHLGELWTLFNFINPGLLSSQERFNARFAIPLERRDGREARKRLKKLVQPFILRRTKAQVLEELPPRTEVVLQVELGPEETAFYEALRRQALERLELDDSPAGQKHLKILAEIMRLRRACCHPRLVMPATDLAGAKLELFGEVVAELLENRHKALVFSQFVGHLHILREYLDAHNLNYRYLDGSTPPKERKREVDAFQAGSGDLFLISLKAGGLGLNLTAADYVIHMDPWWNPAVEDQASDRAHRIGQLRPVTVYRLVTRNTIEEKILKLHQEKRDLASSLLDGSDMVGRMSADELLKLVKEQ